MKTDLDRLTIKARSELTSADLMRLAMACLDEISAGRSSFDPGEVEALHMKCWSMLQEYEHRTPGVIA